MKPNNECNNFDRMVESVRLSYVHALAAYLKLYKKYEQFKSKINEEGLKKYFHLVDLYFYDETGNFDWDNIRFIMPLNLEKTIKAEYDTLSDTEIRLCCLLLFDIPGNDIASILSFTQTSIHSKTHIIKKKTGMKDIKKALKSLLIISRDN